MRFLVRGAVVLLLLGLITNIAVAWSSVWWAPLPAERLVVHSKAGSVEGPDYEYLSVSRWDRFAASLLFSDWATNESGMRSPSIFTTGPDPQGFTPDWASDVLPDGASTRRAKQWRLAEARGWPALSLSWHVGGTSDLSDENHHPTAPETISQEIRRGIPISPVKFHPFWRHPDSIRTLPIHVLWKGFVLNTLFYATAWSLLIGWVWAAWLVRCDVSRRFLARLGLASIGCAALSAVAVTWALAIWGSGSSFEPRSTDAAQQGSGSNTNYWILHKNRWHFVTQYISYWQDRSVESEATPEEILPTWGAFMRLPETWDPQQRRVRIATSFGWPVRCTWCAIEFDLASRMTRRTTVCGVELQTAPQLVGWRWSLGVLPYGPIWSGLIINTLVYSVPWFGLLLMLRVPRALRRRRRTKLGVCIQCGYDLTHSTHEACPECGTDQSRA